MPHPSGASLLADAVVSSPRQCLTTLDLRSNNCGVAGAKAIAKGLLSAQLNSAHGGILSLNMAANYLKAEVRGRGCGIGAHEVAFFVFM